MRIKHLLLVELLGLSTVPFLWVAAPVQACPVAVGSPQLCDDIYKRFVQSQADESPEPKCPLCGQGESSEKPSLDKPAKKATSPEQPVQPQAKKQASQNQYGR
jgi:hypothetical protein